jgi:hypothetical protein
MGRHHRRKRPSQRDGNGGVGRVDGACGTTLEFLGRAEFWFEIWFEVSVEVRVEIWFEVSVEVWFEISFDVWFVA